MLSEYMIRVIMQERNDYKESVMGKNKKKDIIESYDNDTVEVPVEEVVEPIIDDEVVEPVVDDLIRVRINANVNSYKKGDELLVEASNTLVLGLVKQGIAEVI